MASDTIAVCKRAGFESFVYEGPAEGLCDLVGYACCADAPMTADGLVSRFRVGDKVTEASFSLWMLRLATSAQICAEEDNYLPFILGTELPGDAPFTSARDYCSRCVDPMETEAEHVSIAALAAALRLRVRVAYLDGGMGGPSASGQLVTFHEFGDEAEGDNGDVVLHLLYRPGHYDLLYR
jgi:ubiquitin thioesterase protein OTUB1